MITIIDDEETRKIMQKVNNIGASVDIVSPRAATSIAVWLSSQLSLQNCCYKHVRDSYTL